MYTLSFVNFQKRFCAVPFIDYIININTSTEICIMPAKYARYAKLI